MCALAEDPSADVRAAAALHMVEVCHVVGPIVTCSRLLSPFCKLATDPIRNVRRSFLDSLIGVSQLLHPQQSAQQFIPIVRRLLNDTNRLVRLSVHKVLGPFLTSLVDPSFIPIDLIQEFLALASSDTKDSFHTTVNNLMLFHSPTSLLGRTPNGLVDDNSWWFGATENGMQQPSMSDPSVLFAFSFAAVLWTLCGRGNELYEIGKPFLPRKQRFDKIYDTRLNQDSMDENEFASIGENSCAALGGINYWWALFRPALLGLLNATATHQEASVSKNNSPLNYDNLNYFPSCASVAFVSVV